MKTQKYTVDWTMDDLTKWDQLIMEQVKKFGLNVYSQLFQIADHHDMLLYMTYHGVPVQYPHWSWGKSYEKNKTLYDYGVGGLPYEMVINSDPCLAYLMKDNTILLQILTMAHVYGHNDFFKNNTTFQYMKSEYVIDMFRQHAHRIRKYTEDPSIGLLEVEKWLDACHSIRYNCPRYPGIKRLSREEQKKEIIAEYQSKVKRQIDLGGSREDVTKPDLKKKPLEPDEDILIFIRDNQLYLEEWQKDIMTIVHDHAKYFLPNIQTRIMNEGWATFWHKKIIEALDLAQGLHQEFLVKHNQVVAPHKNRINPYYLGFRIWQDIFERWENPSDEDKERLGLTGGQGYEQMLFVREVDRDASFLRQYLTEKLIRDMDLFAHQENEEGDHVITEVADEENWQEVKKVLVANCGIENVPVVKIEDANYKKHGIIYLKHYPQYYDEVLDPEYAMHTMKYVIFLWGGEVLLETRRNGKRVILKIKDGDLKVIN